MYLPSLYTQNYGVFGLHPSSCILETRKHNVSETGSVSVLKWDTYSIGSLRKSWPQSLDKSVYSQQPPAHAGSSLEDISILKMEAIRSFETLVHTRSTRPHIPEDDILQVCIQFCVFLWGCSFLTQMKGYVPIKWQFFLSSYAMLNISVSDGRAIAQAVNRWLPTAAARVRTQVWSCGICGGQSGAGASFLRVLRVPLPIFIPPVAPQSPSSIIWGLYNRPEVAAVPSGLSLTPLIIKNLCVWYIVVK
jgi:hypothetical protein